MSSRILYKTNTDRLNPQFIGIADKFNTHKKNRAQIEKQYKTYYSNFHYLQKLNQNLDRSLESKRIQVAKAKNAYQRHQSDIARKQEQDRKKKNYIEFLHHKSVEHRKNHSKIMESRISQMKKEKKMNHNMIKQTEYQIKSDLMNKKHQEKQENQYKFHSIETQKSNGIQKINKFHRNRNSVSLNNYFEMINNQDEKAGRYLHDIEKIKKTMKRYAKVVQNKNSQLQSLNIELKKYNTISSSKNNNLTKSSKRDTLSQCSRRSNPRDILLDRLGEDDIELHNTLQQAYATK